MPDIDVVLECFRQNPPRPQNRQAAIQGVVLQLLSGLGWDVLDRTQVIPQLRERNYTVDFCLKAGNRQAYLNVKDTIEKMEEDEACFMEWAARADQQLIAVQTTGLLWWFYLPRLPVVPSQRWFFEIDIQGGPRDDEHQEAIARCFRMFMQRENIEDGYALAKARKFVEDCPPFSAWHQLCKNPSLVTFQEFMGAMKKATGVAINIDLLLESLKQRPHSHPGGPRRSRHAPHLR